MFTLKNFNKWSSCVLPKWLYFVNLHIETEKKVIFCNSDSIEGLVKQIHEELEKRKMSRNNFNADFNFSANNCSSNSIGAKRIRPFSEEDESKFLNLLTATT